MCGSKTNLQKEVIFENSLHWQCQKVTQSEHRFIRSRLTLLVTTATTSVDHFANHQPTNQSTNQPINQSINQPTNQSINHPSNQSINQSIINNQSINQSMCRRRFTKRPGEAWGLLNTTVITISTVIRRNYTVLSRFVKNFELY